jgi:CHAD domain-containing protein
VGRRLRETERKYEAGTVQAGEPDLDGIDGVASVRLLEPVTLDAVYFDTTDLRLARHRIALRRRTGGDDAGWHLKLPAETADTRTEVHAPLGRASRTVPKALAAEVTVHTRGRSIVPVVRLKNNRERVHLLDEAGAILAEIAHDHVTAQLLDGLEGIDSANEPLRHWSETEVELIGDDPGLLDAVEERLAAAGLHRSASPSKLAHALGDRLPATPPVTTPPTHPQTAGAVLAYLHTQVQAIVDLDPAVRRDEPDAVHRMRVATRRLRSTLRTYARELDRSVTDSVSDELKWLASVLGAERDREVLTARLVERVAELGPDLATDTVIERLQKGMGASHPRTRTALLKELRSERYFALLDTLDALLADPPLRDRAKRPAHQAVLKAVRREHRRLARKMATAFTQPPGSSRDLALHEARKAAKRVRYAAESAQPVLGRPAQRHQIRITGVQQLLGEHQDSVMCRAALMRIARQAHAAGEDTFAYGALYQLEHDRAAEVEDALPTAWRRADRGKLSGDSSLRPCRKLEGHPYPLIPFPLQKDTSQCLSSRSSPVWKRFSRMSRSPSSTSVEN